MELSNSTSSSGSSSSNAGAVGRFESICTALDSILGSDILNCLHGETVSRKGNQSLNEHSLRLSVDVSNLRSKGETIAVNRPPLENCYMLINQFRTEIVIVGTFAQYATLIAEKRDGQRVWKRAPHMYLSSDFNMSAEFRQGLVVLENDEEEEEEEEADVCSEVDSKFTDYNCKTYEDVINLFEVGIKPNENTPAMLPYRELTSTVREKYWTESSNSERFSVFCIYYIYIHLKKDELDLKSAIKKTDVKNEIRRLKKNIKMYDLQMNVSDEYYDYAVRLVECQELAMAGIHEDDN